MHYFINWNRVTEEEWDNRPCPGIYEAYFRDGALFFKGYYFKNLDEFQVLFLEDMHGEKETDALQVRQRILRQQSDGGRKLCFWQSDVQGPVQCQAALDEGFPKARPEVWMVRPGFVLSRPRRWGPASGNNGKKADL